MLINEQIEKASDQILIDGILAGETHLYSEIIRRYNQRVYRVCRSFIRDESTVEDIMQEGYIKAFQNLSGFQSRSSFSTWLTRIMINECLMHKRRQVNSKFVELNHESIFMNPSSSNSPENIKYRKELKVILEKKIDDLPEKYKLVFMLREVENMSTKETCQALDLTDSNVKVRLNRAKSLLKESLLQELSYSELYDFELTRCSRISSKVMGKIL